MDYDRIERMIRITACAVLIEFVVLGLAMAFGTL